MKKKILKLLVGSLCLSALIGIFIILFGSFNEIEGKILLTTLLIFGYSIPGLCASTIYEKEKLHSFSILGISLSLISCIYMLGLLWEFFSFDFFNINHWKIIFSLNILCLSTGHLSLILLINNQNNIVSTFKISTVVISIIIDLMILTLIWDLSLANDLYFRILLVLGILATLGTVGTPILNKIYKQENTNDITNNMSPETINNQNNITITDDQLNYNHNNKKSKNLIIISIIIASILLVLGASHFKYRNIKIETIQENKNIKEILDNVPNYNYYDTSNYYFIYNDKIYYYTSENSIDKFNYMDLDGSNNKTITQNNELRYAQFYFVYDNEAYYYTMYDAENKKINLTTGKISSLNNDDIYISKSLKNGIVNSFSDHAIAGNAYSFFKQFDLKKNKVIYEIKTNHSMAGKEYFLDYNRGYIYYLENYYSKRPTIYQNNEILYEFSEEAKYNFADIKFMACNEKYLYFKNNNYLYKLNINTKEIEKEINYNLGDIHRISSGNNNDNYFYISNKIYTFDFDSDTFNLLLKNIENEPQELYNINNKLIFTENTNNLKYNMLYENLGSVVVYDLIKRREISQYKGIRNIFFDNNQMYLVVNGEKNYYVDKIDLNK